MSDHAEFHEIYDASVIWRRFLRRRWAKIPDIDAEIDAAIWEHYQRGVREQRALFDAVSVTVRRYVRREQRSWDVSRREMTFCLDRSRDDGRVLADEVVDRVAAEAMVAEIDIPDRVLPVLARRLGESSGAIAHRDRIYAYRWTRRMRTALADA